MPTPNLTSLERAFELAKSGRCRTTEEIQRALKEEGHDPKRVIGPYLMRQLRALMSDRNRGTPRGSSGSPPQPGPRGRPGPH